MHDVDRAIEKFLAEKGRRLVTRGEVLLLGGDDSFIQSRRDRHRWFEVQPGVYVIGLGDLSPYEQRLAALLAVPWPAALSQVGAFFEWGLDGVRWAPLELTVPHSTHVHVQGAIVHRSRRLEHFVTKGALTVTSVERTLLEAAPRLGPAIIEKGLASAWRKGLTTPTKCLEYVDEFGSPWRKGSKLLASVAARYDHGGRPPGSDGEVFVWRLLEPALIEAGIEMPVRQFELKLPDGSSATIDFAWPVRRKGIEPGGLKGHGAARDQAYDYYRRAQARLIGWELEPFAPFQFEDRPRETIGLIIRFLQSPSLPLSDAA